LASIGSQVTEVNMDLLSGMLVGALSLGGFVALPWVVIYCSSVRVARTGLKIGPQKKGY
jgi:hypothetical protein